MDNFVTNFKDLEFHDSNDNMISGEGLDDYFKQLEQDAIYTEKLSEGDLVKIKGSDDLISVKYVNYEVPNVGVVDYAGVRIDEEGDWLVLFNQKDIEEAVKVSSRQL